MSYTALYRKWRPDTFEEVRGQDHLVRTLKNQIISKRVGHAYLFCGTRGTGKTSIAKIFAKAVNCENPQDGSPCNECRACKNIISGTSFNVVEIDAASNNGVENIREIREQVQYPPTEGIYRVYIIDEVHMLSSGAFNALLKTLEEPPSYVIFILATTEVHKIPITVLSRCQRYDFRRISIQTITNQLKQLSVAEEIAVEDKALQYIAKVADGSMRDALSLLDQCVAFHYGNTLTYNDALDVLGAVDTSIFSQLFRAVIKEQTVECIYKLEEMIIQGRDLGQFVIDFTWYLRNLLLIKSSDAGTNDLLDVSEENKKALTEDSDLISHDILVRYIRVFSELSNQIRYASQKRVLIELAFIKLTKPQMEYNFDSIIQRLEMLESRPAQQIIVNPEDSTVSQQNKNIGLEPPKQIVISATQLEDLQMVRNDWNKIVRDLGGVIRSSFRDTMIEPAGDDSLCVVFTKLDTYEIGKRESTLGDLEDYVKNKYGKIIHFKARLKGHDERMDTIYVSEDDLKNNIQMDITIEE